MYYKYIVFKRNAYLTAYRKEIIELQEYKDVSKYETSEM